MFCRSFPAWQFRDICGMPTSCAIEQLRNKCHTHGTKCYLLRLLILALQSSSFLLNFKYDLFPAQTSMLVRTNECKKNQTRKKSFARIQRKFFPAQNASMEFSVVFSSSFSFSYICPRRLPLISSPLIFIDAVISPTPTLCPWYVTRSDSEWG